MLFIFVQKKSEKKKQKQICLQEARWDYIRAFWPFPNPGMLHLHSFCIQTHHSNMCPSVCLSVPRCPARVLVVAWILHHIGHYHHRYLCDTKRCWANIRFTVFTVFELVNKTLAYTKKKREHTHTHTQIPTHRNSVRDLVK